MIPMNALMKHLWLCCNGMCILGFVAFGSLGCSHYELSNHKHVRVDGNGGDSANTAKFDKPPHKGSLSGLGSQKAAFDYNFHIRIAGVRKKLRCLEVLKLLGVVSSLSWDDPNIIFLTGGCSLGQYWRTFGYGPLGANGGSSIELDYYGSGGSAPQNQDFLVDGISIDHLGDTYTYVFDHKRERYIFHD